jgi:hypothetical protein
MKRCLTSCHLGLLLLQVISILVLAIRVRGRTWTPHFREPIVVSFDDDTSHSEPQQRCGILQGNATALVTAAREAAPGYACELVLGEALAWLAPPLLSTARLVWVATQLKRGEDFRSVAEQALERLVLKSPLVHVSIAGAILRRISFRTWRHMRFEIGMLKGRVREQARRVRLLGSRRIKHCKEEGCSDGCGASSSCSRSDDGTGTPGAGSDAGGSELTFLWDRMRETRHLGGLFPIARDHLVALSPVERQHSWSRDWPSLSRGACAGLERDIHLAFNGTVRIETRRTSAARRSIKWLPNLGMRKLLGEPSSSDAEFVIRDLEAVELPGTRLSRVCLAFMSRVEEEAEEDSEEEMDRARPGESELRAVVIKRPDPLQLELAADDVTRFRRAVRRLRARGCLDVDDEGLADDLEAVVSAACDMRVEASNIAEARSNLEAAGLLRVAVEVPEVVTLPEHGRLASETVLITTALRGVPLADTYTMEHAVAHEEGQRMAWIGKLLLTCGHMLLVDGLFPSNPLPEHLLYTYEGRVGLVDAGSLVRINDDFRKALCGLYVELGRQGRCGGTVSPADDLRAQRALEACGVALNLNPRKNRSRPLNYSLLARALFDVQLGGLPDYLRDPSSAVRILRSLGVKRLPQPVVATLRMVSCLRCVCAALDVDVSVLPVFARQGRAGLKVSCPSP